MAWFDNTPGNDEILYRRSTNSGVNFGSTLNISNESFQSFLPSITVSGSNVHIIWYLSAAAEVLYRRNTDGGASFEPQSSTLSHTGGNPSIAVS